MNEPLLLLPGMMCDARLFQPQIAEFSQRQAVAFAPLFSSNSMTGLAKQVLENAPPRFALAGLSMGGIVAMEMIRLAPDRITRIALMDTNPLADPPEKSGIRRAQVANAKRGRLREIMRDEMKPNYLADGPSKARILALCMEMAESLGPEVFEAQSDAIQHRPDQCDTLKSVAVPALILCGEEDRLCPVSRHELMHELIPGSQLAVVPGAGHLPTLEQPELTNSTLSEWLSA
ncbi:alpha/beta hydrolase [Chromatiales bacterium (ex Bugula neritina AB1)]|nr:alpha/beta hydrolase [Chromatiales bacterium (ex Bugula neritina AB1)]